MRFTFGIVGIALNTAADVVERETFALMLSAEPIGLRERKIAERPHADDIVDIFDNPF